MPTYDDRSRGKGGYSSKSAGQSKGGYGKGQEKRTGRANPRSDARPSQTQAPRGGGKPAQRQDERPAYGPRADARPGGKSAPRTDARPAYAPRTDAHPDQKSAPRGGKPAYSSRQNAYPAPATRPPQVKRQMRPVVVPPPTPVPASFDGEEPLPRENILAGRNPIREALRSGRDIERMLVAKGELSGSAREIVAMARERHIVVQVVDRARLDEITGSHQGMIAFASAFRYGTLEDMLALAKERGQDPLLVILDGVTDPHNLGAIIRSAECAGAHGVIVPERRAVGLTPAAVKASAGAVEYLPVARAGNLSRLLDELKRLGIWAVAADMGGEPYDKADLTGPLALIIGGEGSGVTRLVLEHADRRVALPMAGHIDSLNASVAAGVLLYEIRRQRG